MFEWSAVVLVEIAIAEAAEAHAAGETLAKSDAR
jgi:hypothetical protein